MRRRYVKYGAMGGIALLLGLWLFGLPAELFEGVAYSTVVTDRRGELLGARIADDGQWRFPPGDSLPDKFVTALVEFEDRTFFRHPGFSLRALGRAAIQNLRNGRVVSGGSTLTMQVVRLSRRKPRTLWQKTVEIFLATRLEVRCSKEEILRLYASHAPFGGNVVGFEAARWRYLGHDGEDLSWAEAATLAVLQNAPSSVRPDRNREVLRAKRDRLLRRLADRGFLSEEDYAAAVEEPLLGRPYPMPQTALHLVERYDRERHGLRSRTGIDRTLQRRVEELTARWNRELRTVGIHDLATVVIEVEGGRTIAYCGNADPTYERPGQWVDIARAPRSSGSILKPLLYGMALQEGTILPKALLPDVPTDFGGFAPKNFDGTYAGAIPADEALALSLNVPNVHLLRQFGTMRLAEVLKRGGLLSLRRPANQYGLSLILGGAEVRLAEVTEFYARMAACYQAGDSVAGVAEGFPLRDRVALYRTFEAMRRVNRPDQLDVSRVASAQDIAWKTGTSYGARDAWAVGLTPRYVVGVWVGNAQGNGAPGLTGAHTAGPILFDLFNLLPASEWFAPPGPTEGVAVAVCARSGHRAGRACTDTVRMLVPRRAAESSRCPYCREVAVSLDGARRVADRSEPTRTERYFVLPPLMEHYYRQGHPEYVVLPPLRHDGSAGAPEDESMRFLYPANGAVLSLPRQMDGTPGSVSLSLVHTRPERELFWHLDGAYLGSTRDLHRMAISPTTGYHVVTVVDETGQSLSVEFVVV